MGLFDFVENFFFIGLALLFVLVLLLVYHFKQRMNSVEKKGDNMFDLLTNVVRELRNIRTNIGGGGGGNENVVAPPPTIQATYSKVEPEESDDESEYMSDSDSEDDGVDDAESDDDGITYQIIDSKEKVVVSDESESSDSGSDSGSDSDSQSDEDDVALETNEIEPDMSYIPTEPITECFSEEVPLEEDICEIPGVSHEEEGEISTTAATETDEIQPITRSIGGANQEKLNSYKKMNVNQLKALAIQAGIQGDTSKLKKTALIELLLEKQV